MLYSRELVISIALQSQFHDILSNFTDYVDDEDAFVPSLPGSALE